MKQQDWYVGMLKIILHVLCTIAWFSYAKDTEFGVPYFYYTALYWPCDFTFGRSSN